MTTRRVNKSILEIADGSGGTVLSVCERLEGTSMILELSGRLRSDVAHEFEDEVMAALFVCDEVVLDMKNVDHISGMGLDSLVYVCRTAAETEGSSLRLVNVSEDFVPALKGSGLDPAVWESDGNLVNDKW